MSIWEQVIFAALAAGVAAYRSQWEKQSSEDVGTRGMARVKLQKDHRLYGNAHVIRQIYDGSAESGFVTLTRRLTYVTQHRQFEQALLQACPSSFRTGGSL